jgi:rhodanese-related sulfurtransferase
LDGRQFDEVSNKGADTRRVWIAEAQMNQDFHDLYRDEKPLVAICRLGVAKAIAAGVIKLEQAA